MCKSLKALSTQKYIAFKGKQGKQTKSKANGSSHHNSYKDKKQILPPHKQHYIYTQVTSVGKWTGLFNPLYGPDLVH